MRSAVRHNPVARERSSSTPTSPRRPDWRFVLIVLPVVVGVLVAWGAETRLLFLLLPVWLFVRMALNAVDGAQLWGESGSIGAAGVFGVPMAVLDGELFITTALIATLVGVLAALLPALRAARLDPVVAIRG